MYYKRKIDEYLNNWKEDPSHKALIVKGARQDCKTKMSQRGRFSLRCMKELLWR